MIPPHDSPTIGSERIETLDVVRGVALCGLVPMNILDFGFAEDLFLSSGSLAGFDRGLWSVIMIFGSGKFMALFSLLFGAGIILSTAKRDAASEPVAAFYLKRLGWLWFFGMLHAYLIWHGDILVSYAATGFILFWCRRWSVRAQGICGTLMLCVVPALVLLIWVLCVAFDPGQEVWEKMNAEWTATDEGMITAFRGGWLDQMPTRALLAFVIQVIGIPLLIFWIAGGLMFLGMALMKSGFFSGEWTAPRYRKWALICTLTGLTACTLSGVLNYVAGGGLPHTILYSLPAIAGTPVLALGYASLFVLWIKARPLGRLQSAFAALGRMAFSNYIGQSIILGLVFYGHGLGLYGYLRFTTVMAVVPAVWIFQAILSVLWMKRFQFGPLEWAWRCLTYGRKFRLRRIEQKEGNAPSLP